MYHACRVTAQVQSLQRMMGVADMTAMVTAARAKFVAAKLADDTPVPAVIDNDISTAEQHIGGRRPGGLVTLVFSHFLRNSIWLRAKG